MDFDSLLDEMTDEKPQHVKSGGRNLDNEPENSKKVSLSKAHNPKSHKIEKKNPRPATTKDYRNYSEKSEDEFSQLLDMEAEEVSVNESIDPTKSIEERIAELRESTKSDLEKEKEELAQIAQEKIQEKKKFIQESLDVKKKMFEQELKELEDIRNSYQKMEALADNLGFNTNLLNNLSQKISDTKEVEDYAKSDKLVQFERSLEEREARLVSQELQLDRDKLTVQEHLEIISKMEADRKIRFEEEEKQLKFEKDKIYAIFSLVSQQGLEKKQEIIRESQKVKAQQDSLMKRKDELRNGVDFRLQQLSEYQELIIQKHEETLKLINQERRQLSEKRERIEEARRETSGFEEKINQQSEVIEKREQELNHQVEELIKSKNLLESHRGILEGEMQALHQLSLKLHSQSEEISKSKEQLEYETNYLLKLEEETENLKISSKHEMVAAKEYCRQLDQQMRTYEKMSVNLIQDLHNDIVTPYNFNN